MDEVLTLPRMARRLGVTARWLRAEAETGRVPCLRAGRRFLFNPVAVEQTLARRAAEGGEGLEASANPQLPDEESEE